MIDSPVSDPVYCSRCGERLIEVTVSRKGGCAYSPYSGQLIQDQYWRCPKYRKILGIFPNFHDNEPRMMSRSETAFS